MAQYVLYAPAERSVQSQGGIKTHGHAKEIITMDVYADNRGIIADGVPEIEEYMKEVLPNPEEIENFKKELLEIVVDITEFLPETA